MKSWKKSVVALLVIGSLSVAGMAFAAPGKGKAAPVGPGGGHHHMRMQPGNGNMPPAPQPWNGPCCCTQKGPMEGQPPMGFGPGTRGPRGGRPGMFAPDMPKEIRAKAVEAAKLRIDLADVLSQRPLDRKRAIELNGQIGKLKQEIRDWRFEQKLNRIEKFGDKPAEGPEEPAESAEPTEEK